jgi:hypothetical protein
VERRCTFDTLLTQILAVKMLALRCGSLRGLVDVWIRLAEDIQGGIAGVQRRFQIAPAQNRASCTVPIGANLLCTENERSERSCVDKSTAVTVLSLQAVVVRCLAGSASADTRFYGVSLYLAACKVTRRFQAVFCHRFLCR